MVGDKTTAFFTTNIQNYNRRVSMYILQIHIMQFMSEKRDEEDQTITKKCFSAVKLGIKERLSKEQT